MSRKVLKPVTIAATAVLASMSPALGQAPMPFVGGPRGIVADPCPPPLAAPSEMAIALRNPDQPPPAAVAAFLEETNRRAQLDWANLCRYAPENARLTAAGGSEPVAVLLGDSITEGWARNDARFFATNRFVGRGISGQVSSQTLLRFRQDVADLHPKVVHIMIGTNDVAGNGGPTTYRDVERNLAALVQLARASGIRVVLATIPPTSDFPWHKGMEPSGKIMALNTWIRDYANQQGIVVADYHAALKNRSGGFRSEWSGDGVHPNVAGYAVMKPIAAAAIASAMKQPRLTFTP